MLRRVSSKGGDTLEPGRSGKYSCAETLILVKLLKDIELLGRELYADGTIAGNVTDEDEYFNVVVSLKGL